MRDKSGLALQITVTTLRTIKRIYQATGRCVNHKSEYQLIYFTIFQ